VWEFLVFEDVGFALECQTEGLYHRTQEPDEDAHLVQESVLACGEQNRPEIEKITTQEIAFANIVGQTYSNTAPGRQVAEVSHHSWVTLVSQGHIDSVSELKLAGESDGRIERGTRGLCLRVWSSGSWLFC
jgi:hypothetical protein